MASGLDQLGKLMQLQQMANASKASAYRQQQDRSAALRQQQTYDINLEKLSMARGRVEQERTERSNKLRLSELIADRIGGFGGQGGELGPEPARPVDFGEIREKVLASGIPGAMETAKDISGFMPSSASASSVFGQQMRALGTDLGFYSQEYGGGEVPSNIEELEGMTTAAAKDPEFGRKRQEWSNLRIANTLKNLGVSTEDPSLNVYQDRFGKQTLVSNRGDTIAQQLKTPTTEETTKLAEYRNTYNEIDNISKEMNTLFTGIYQGNWNNLKSKFAGTPDFQKFKTKTNQLRTIIYGLSGKQINQTEQVWLDTILPKLYQPDENFQANLDTLKEWIEDRQQTYLIELKNSRRFTATKPLGAREEAGAAVRYSADQEDAAFDALGMDASDEDLDAWLLDKYGGE